jgi:galactokinase
MAVDLGDIFPKYQEVFGHPPSLAVSAPGRVNLIGEHTDYNEGFVLPVAIDFDTKIVASLRDDTLVFAYAANLDEEASFDTAEIHYSEKHRWINYVAGTILMAQQAGLSCGGLNMSIRGDIPIGAGLSSSASIEMAVLKLVEIACGKALPGPEAAALGRRAENQFVGVQCGIMDQFISRMGVKDHALFLDCRSHEYRQVPLPFVDYNILICDTRVERKLESSKYNERVGECGEGSSVIAATMGKEITSLRDASPDDLKRAEPDMRPEVARRCRHVISENDRVIESVAALEQNDMARFGRLLYESHASLKDDYQVSCRELDAMVEVARECDGVIGARMTGAGFGGCAIAVVKEEHVSECAEQIRRRYQETTGIEPAVYACGTSDGARQLDVE